MHILIAEIIDRIHEAVSDVCWLIEIGELDNGRDAIRSYIEPHFSDLKGIQKAAGMTNVTMRVRTRLTGLSWRLA